MSELQLINGDQSPFDAIRRVRPDGSEYWSARDLMPLMGYQAWRNFLVPIVRAMKSAENQGQPGAFAESRNRVTAGSGTTERQDFELSRFAAYLVAMNGDPNKPEVAAAQAYFAIMTREAEAVRAIDISDPIAAIEAAHLRAGQAIEVAKAERERAERAERLVAVEQSHRRAIEGGDGILLGDFGKKYFSEVRYTDFFEHLYAKKWLIDQRGTRTRPDGEVRDGHDHRKPTYKGRPFIYAHDTGVHGGQRRFQPRVRPQREIEFRDALAAEGLPVNAHSTGLVLVAVDELRELGQ